MRGGVIGVKQCGEGGGVMNWSGYGVGLYVIDHLLCLWRGFYFHHLQYQVSIGLDLYM